MNLEKMIVDINSRDIVSADKSMIEAIKFLQEIDMILLESEKAL